MLTGPALAGTVRCRFLIRTRGTGAGSGGLASMAAAYGVLPQVKKVAAVPASSSAIVGLGANDGLRGLDPKEMAANLSAILDTLAAKHSPVLFTGMYVQPNLGPAYERGFRAVFNRLGKRPGLLYDPFFLQGVAEVPDLTQPDGLHPNAAGVWKIVQRILPLVERLLVEVRNS